MFRFVVCVAALACVATTAYAGVSHAPSSYASPDVVDLPQEAEAQANAQTNNAGAIASAAKINAINLNALNQYGYQLGIPLLTKPYGALTGLIAGAEQPRSFVGKVDPVFIRGPYGNIQHVAESTIGVLVI